MIFILYLNLVFFIIICNILLVLIIEKKEFEQEVFSSDIGKKINNAMCNDNQWFIFNNKQSGLEIFYMVDEKGNPIKCNQPVPKNPILRQCSAKDYLHTRSSCTMLLTELMFYRNQK